MVKSSPPEPVEDIRAQLSESEQRYIAFIGNSLEAIWRFEMAEPIDIALPRDTQIELTFQRAFLAEANDAMAKMYGYETADQIIGSRLADMLDPKNDKNIRFLRAVFDSNYNLQGLETEELDRFGNKKYFLNSLSCIIEDGLLYGAWGSQLDVTPQRQMNLDLQKSQERLDLALKVSGVGMWEWDITANTLLWTDEEKKLFGLSPDEEVTYDKYLSLIHPTDKNKMELITKKSMEDGLPYEVEYRVVWKNGEVHWLAGRWQAFLEDGKPVRMIGTAMNIDDHKSAEKLKVQNALLSQERTELLRVSRSKEEFIALASHQLRTPATGVKQFLGMLLEGYAGELRLTDEQRRMLQTAYDGNDRQIAIVNDLLMVATIDAGKVSLKKEPTDIVSFVHQLIDDIRPRYRSHNQELACNCPGKPINLTIDPGRLRMALENLLDNASKYSPEGSDTTVSIRKKRSSVDIAITDHGVGIEQEDFDKLFQKFSRIHNSLSVSSGGSGLGLYWSHKLIGLHGGKLTVTSEPGKGSTFTVKLPLD
jgi:PAS domain S-box-containing protein